MSDSASLKVALVGPTHPYKGGVAAHTTALAHELTEAGHDVTLVSWSHLYPSALYPGEQSVPGGSMDVEPFPRTLRVLSWARPDTWVRAGRRLRDVDVIVVVHVIPAVVPAHLALLRAAGAGRSTPTGRGPRTVLIAHNVLPHEGHPGDRQLMEALLRRVDAVVVHSDEQARLAAELGAGHVRELDLPPHLPGGAPQPRPDHDGPPRLLTLGIVRDYKGVDLLVDALRDVPDLSLTVAGEMWGDAGRRVRELAADPRLEGRVEVHAGYVPAERIPELMAHHDVVALTYRTATASQNALLALSHGVPVLASAVGTFPDQVRDDVDGLLVPPSDREALVAALRHLAEPGVVERLRAEVRTPDLSGPWANYVGGIEALAAAPVEVEPTRPVVPLGPVARARATVAGIRARRGPVVELAPTDSPSGCAPPTCSPSTPTPWMPWASPARSACPAPVSRWPPGRPWARWPPSCGSATTGTARRSSSTRAAAAARWAAGRGPSASPRSSSSSPGGGPPSRCSTSTPPASTSSPGCTPAGARHPTSTTPSGRPRGRCAPAGCSCSPCRSATTTPTSRCVPPACAASWRAPTTWA